MANHTSWRQQVIAVGCCCSSVLIGLSSVPCAVGQAAHGGRIGARLGCTGRTPSRCGPRHRPGGSIGGRHRPRSLAGRRCGPGRRSESEFFEYAAGVIIDARGLILTNYHLLGNVPASRYVVWLPGSRQFTAKVKAADPWFDLAVLEVAANDLTPLPLGAGRTAPERRFRDCLGKPLRDRA